MPRDDDGWLLDPHQKAGKIQAATEAVLRELAAGVQLAGAPTERRIRYWAFLLGRAASKGRSSRFPGRHEVDHATAANSLETLAKKAAALRVSLAPWEPTATFIYAVVGTPPSNNPGFVNRSKTKVLGGLSRTALAAIALSDLKPPPDCPTPSLGASC